MLSLDVWTVLLTVSMLKTCSGQDRTAGGRVAYLLADVKGETVGLLLSVPAGVVEVQLLDVAVLEVFRSVDRSVRE